MIPSDLNLVSKPEMSPCLAALLSILEKTSSTMLKRRENWGERISLPKPFAWNEEITILIVNSNTHRSRTYKAMNSIYPFMA
jgi:hypothetical protein